MNTQSGKWRYITAAYLIAYRNKLTMLCSLYDTGLLVVFLVASSFAQTDILRSNVAIGSGSKQSSLMVVWNGNAFDFVYQSEQGTATTIKHGLYKRTKAIGHRCLSLSKIV